MTSSNERTASRRDTYLAYVSFLLTLAIPIAMMIPTIYFCSLETTGAYCRFVPTQIGSTDDWRYFLNAWETARVSLMDFHQFPSWNPYHCGGLVLYQDPQSPFPGPIFLLTFFWLPGASAMKLWMFVHLLAGSFGMRRLARDAGGNLPEQLYASVVLCLCGFTGSHFGGGHVSFSPFYLLPWILWAHRRSYSDPRWMLLVSAILALEVYEGATYPLPISLLALAFDMLVHLHKKQAWKQLLASLPLLALFPLLAAARLVPILVYLREHPRLVPLDDSLSLRDLFSAWAMPRPHAHFSHLYVWLEYTTYVGVLPLVLALFGAVIAIVRRDDRTAQRRRELVVLGLLTWCALGALPHFALWSWLHRLPIYRSLRVPSRVLIAATVFLALVSMQALVTVRKWLETRAIRRGSRIALGLAQWAVLLFVAIDMLRVSGIMVQYRPDPPLVRRAASSEFYQAASSDYQELPQFPMRGYGTPACYVPLEWTPAEALWDGKTAQQMLLPPEAGQVTLEKWSPNALTYHAVLRVSARMEINQNYERSWSSTAGVVVPSRNLLSLILPAGDYTFVVRHSPRGLTTGLLLSLLGVALTWIAAKTWKQERLRRVFKQTPDTSRESSV